MTCTDWMNWPEKNCNKKYYWSQIVCLVSVSMESWHLLTIVDDNIMNSIGMLDEFVTHSTHEIGSYIYYIFF